MGWIKYSNSAKKDKCWINSRWIWFINNGNKDISLQIVSTPGFRWEFEVDGCEGEVKFRFWLFFTFYLTFSRIFPEWIYPREYNQFADKEASYIRENKSSEERQSMDSQEKSSGYTKEYYDIINKNKKLRRSHRTKENGWIRTSNREFGLSFHHYSMWWRFWTNSGEWSSDIPKWRHGSFDFVRFLKGKDNVDSQVIFNGVDEIEMPEGKYLCKIDYTKFTRKYQRWWSKSYHRFNFDFGYKDEGGIWIDTPIVHWGKGENSYDCGMDGTYSISLGSDVNNLEEAKFRVIESSNRDRKKYGDVDFSKVSGIEKGYVKTNLIGQF